MYLYMRINNTDKIDAVDSGRKNTPSINTRKDMLTNPAESSKIILTVLLSVRFTGGLFTAGIWSNENKILYAESDAWIN